MKARNLNVNDVFNALQSQNSQVTAGQIGAPPGPETVPFQYTLNVFGRLTDTAEFANVIVKTGPTGEITRVRDVGTVELGAQTYGAIFKVDNKASAGLGISLTPGANALNVAAEVKQRLAELSKSFPQGMQYDVPFDITIFVNESIHEVYKTLFEAAILVLIVILVFLQDWRAMLVPATTVPVTIIGAFAAMAAMGFTVNFATLFAIVLAIGIVVDDAIIVVEGAAHNIDRGMNGHDAAIEAMRLLLGPIIGITLVLLSVFLPAAFLPGLTGQMYAQFALVIAATALISAINAVTLKPEQRNFFFRGVNKGYDKAERGYARLMNRLVNHAGKVTVLALLAIGVTIYGFSRIPAGFIPIEDQGYLLATVQLPDGASLPRTQAVMEKLDAIAHKNPGVDKVVTIAGLSALDNNSILSSSGVAYIILKDWGVRGKKLSLLPMYQSLSRELGAIDEANVRVLPPPPIQGIGNAAGTTAQIELRDSSSDYVKLQGVLGQLMQNAASQSSIQAVISSFRANVPQYLVDVDRVKAQAVGVSVDQVFSALGGYLGSSYVNQFTQFGRTFQVIVQADSQFRLRTEDLKNLSVRNNAGSMIPLSTLVDIKPMSGPSLVSLYNLYPSATVITLPARGHSSGETIGLMEQIAKQSLPPNTIMEWTGLSYQEKLVGNQMYLVFAMAMLLVYLVLCGQYESWYRPLSVILAVPISLIGPVATLKVLGIDNNLYTQIGIVLLIALSAKNAILIVEFARELRLEGKSLADAAVEAARARFRPILMTSFAFILGVLPLVLATGAGANARASIGITVFTGMIASTCLAVLVVPSFFVVIEGFEDWLLARRDRAKQAVVQP